MQITPDESLVGPEGPCATPAASPAAGPSSRTTFAPQEAFMNLAPNPAARDHPNPAAYNHPNPAAPNPTPRPAFGRHPAAALSAPSAYAASGYQVRQFFTLFCRV